MLHRETAVTTAVREGKLREFGMGAQVLADLGITRIRLLTNNPRKIVGLEGYGITVADREPLDLEAVRGGVTVLRGGKASLAAAPVEAPGSGKGRQG